MKGFCCSFYLFRHHCIIIVITVFSDKVRRCWVKSHEGTACNESFSYDLIHWVHNRTSQATAQCHRQELCIQVRPLWQAKGYIR